MYNVLIISPSSNLCSQIRQLIVDNQKDVKIDEHHPLAGIPNPSLDWQQYSIILIDCNLELKNDSGLHWLKIMRTYPNKLPIILMTDQLDIGLNAKAMKLGASHCIVKSEINASNLTSSIRQSIASSEGIVEQNGHADFFNITLSNYPKSEVLNITQDKKMPEEHGEVVVPGYELQKEIAKGGMSTIFKAKRLEDNVTVVLKVLFTSDDMDPTLLTRFMQEYDMITKIEHDSIVTIYERGFASTFSYIALEYLPKGHLGKRIAEKISPTIAMSYLRQIAFGLSAIHQHDIIHRDLKPGNILLKDENTLKIADFGTAKVIDDQAEDMTVLGALFGTPYYMSPEQCTGDRIDKRSDIYSLGIIFYMMLTNRRPFRAKSVQEIMRAHRENIVPTLPSKHKKYQPLIDGMVAKDPDDRFQSADDLVKGIDMISLT